MFHEYPDIVTVDQVCRMLNVGKASAYTLLQERQIRHVRVGRKYIIPKSAVIGFVNQSCYNDEQKKDIRLTLVKKGD